MMYRIDSVFHSIFFCGTMVLFHENECKRSLNG